MLEQYRTILEQKLAKNSPKTRQKIIVYIYVINKMI